MRMKDKLSQVVINRVTHDAYISDVVKVGMNKQCVWSGTDKVSGNKCIQNPVTKAWEIRE